MQQAELRVIVKPRDVKGRDVCLFVSYAPRGRVKNYVRLHLDRLRACGIAIFFIMVADRPMLLNLRDRVGPTVGLVVRQNLGFDFGAWGDVLRAFPHLWEAQTLFLINDSIFGPFGAYQEMFDRIAASKADVIALTESIQRRRHFQSYFMAFRGAPARAAGLPRFWEKVENLALKEDVIQRYELRLLDECGKMGLSSEVLFPAGTGRRVTSLNGRDAPSRSSTVDVGPPTNPTHEGWQDLVKQGYPYLKVEFLKVNPTKAILLLDWREIIGDPQVVRAIDDYLVRGK
jgi:hypothetical protein